jgi:LPXTG-motif cell wall-anchored protein
MTPDQISLGLGLLVLAIGGAILLRRKRRRKQAGTPTNIGAVSQETDTPASQ